MLRVLHFMSSVSKGAGIANVIMTYYRNMDRTKVNFDFLIYYHTDSDFDKEIKCYGGAIYLIPKPRIGTMKHYISELEAFFSKHQGEYDAVHLHEMYMNSIVFPIAKKYGVKCCIAHSHTTLYSDRLISGFRNRIMFLPLKKNATAYFACGKKAGEFAFGKECVEDGNCYILKNALDLNKYIFNPKDYINVRDELNISQDDFVIGHVGRFEAQKNHDFIIKVFCELIKIKSNVKLLLVGSGSNYERIQKVVKESGIEQYVIFTGNRSDVPRLLNAMDIFILPSLFEGLPIVAIEAQASGLPCVVSSTVTNEITIGNVIYRDIYGADAATKWCNALCEIKSNDYEERINYNILVKEQGYDIFAESQKLVDKYKSLIEMKDISE